MACQLTPQHSLAIGMDLPPISGEGLQFESLGMDSFPSIDALLPSSPIISYSGKNPSLSDTKIQDETPPKLEVKAQKQESKEELDVPSLNFTLSGPPTTTSITSSIEDQDTKSARGLHPSRMKRRPNEWKTLIKNSTNFDLFAPGLITLLDFDGIELWAMDARTGDVVNIADTVRDESLLKWSWDSNSWKLAAGKGMIGRVYLTGIAEWENDISKVEDDVFLRCPIAQRLRVKGVGCIPVEAPTGDQIIVFMYSRKELGFDKDKARKKFVEDMIRQWMRNSKNTVRFHSSKKSSVRMVVKRGEKGSSSIQIHKKNGESMPPPSSKAPKNDEERQKQKRRRGSILEQTVD